MVAWIAPAGPVSDRMRAVAVRAAAAVALAGSLGALARIHFPRPATLCPLRNLTGVPCPVCGTTTALARLGRLDAGGALAANPFTLAVLLALILAPALAPAVLPRWRRRPLWQQLTVAGLAVAAAWSWQLARFDVLIR